MPQHQYSRYGRPPDFSDDISGDVRKGGTVHDYTAKPSTMHDHKHKYGTMSGGSALSKSMRYAETWLYGSVSARPTPSRASIFMYPEPPGPSVILGTPQPGGYALVMCSCKDFLTGTARGKKSSTVCKKCGGSRKTWNSNTGTAIRGFGTMRLSQPKSRPELPFLEDLKDPYDIMRKSRLATVSSTLRVPPEGRSRAKSNSPPRRRTVKSKSPPRHRSPDTRLPNRRPLTSNSVVESDSACRKSILECDVNPYELISQYLKNGEANSRYPTDDDELSDNLSENALDDDFDGRRKKSKIVKRFSSTSATVGSRSKKGFLDALRSKWDEQPRSSDPLPGGVSIGGQRIRLFNNSDPLPTVTYANEFVSDSDDNEEEEIYDLEKHKAWFSDKNSSSEDFTLTKTSQVPRISSSPKRPPRKSKSALEPLSKPNPTRSNNDSGVKNRVNFALDVPTQTNRRSNSLTSSASLEIKSILKKPNSTLNLSDSSKPSPTPLSNSSKTGLKNNSSSTSETSSRSVTPTTTKTSFLPSFKEQIHNRKKKQVQFRVNDGKNASLLVEGTAVVAEREKDVTSGSSMQENTPEVIVTDPDSSEVLRLQFFGDNREDAQAVNQTLQEERFLNCMESKSEGDSTVNQDGGETISSRLQRSLSDRTSPGADHTSKFNDTMRLRLRTGRRDTRDTFTEDRRKLPEKRVLSPGRPRPKEPPPPPPPPPVLDEPSSQVAREHFSSDSSYHHKSSEKTLINSFSEDYQPPPPPPPPRQIFPFTKEEIEKIRNKSCTLRPRSSSNSPVRQSSDSTSIMERVFPRRTSLTFPITNSSKEDGEITMWHRESSVVNNDFTLLMPLEENVPATEAFSCVTEVYEALQKNSKEIEEIGGRIIINNREGSVEKSVKLVVPSDESHSAIPLEQEVNEKSRTIVTVSSPTQKLSVTSPKPQPQTKTSIMIVGKENEVNKGFNKTSLVIGEYKSPIKESRSNKVTINVGGCDYQNVKNKTAKNNTQIEIRNEFKSNITIGPNDNKSRTLLILKPSAINTTADNITKENQTVVNPELTTEKTIDTAAQEEMNELIRNKIDPVEAVRKNIVPHVCGKVVLEEIKGKRVTCTSDEVRKLTNTGNKFVDKKDTSTEEITNHADITTKTGNIADRKIPIFDSQELTETEERLEDDVFSIKDETEENSDCYVCAKNLRKSLSCKPEDEEVRLGLEFDSDENHYETIKDPIYEEISDTPPPLPLSPPPTSVDIDSSIPTRSIFEGASKYDILNYLETAKERGIVVESEDDSEIRSPEHSRISSLDLSSRISQLSNASDSSEESCNLIISPTDSASITSDKVRKSSVEIERNDSGVGSETSKCSRSRWQHLPASQQHSCEDCDQAVETQVTDSGLMFAPLVCRKCAKRRAERREIITEIVETEEKYGRDLKIILDEFYRPMLVAGLLTPEQLSAIFLNVEELLENNATLAEKLRDALEIAIDQGDEDFLTVNIGTIFLDAVPMLHAFESYCTRQGAASLLLANLEKEKELLRIFLRVSQMENSVLRRMNLNSFLMVPVQRVTKYPLLLARLYRVTPTHLKSREALRVAQTKIELHLEHINSLAKDISTTKLWRRISIINGRRTSSEIDMINIKLRKVAVDVLEWNHDEVRFAMEGKLLFTQPTDNNWRRGRTIKLSPINAMLVTLGKPTEDYQPDSDELLAFPRKNGIRDATLLLLKEKSGRYGLLREPLFLDRCIICCEADIEDYFEVQELATKDTYLFKAEDGDQTKRWFRQLQYHAQGLGAWRKRRNALANIMINGMQLRT